MPFDNELVVFDAVGIQSLTGGVLVKHPLVCRTCKEAGKAGSIGLTHTKHRWA